MVCFIILRYDLGVGSRQSASAGMIGEQARIDTTQVSASIKPPQLKRAVEF